MPRYRYWMMNSEYDFVEISKLEFENEQTNDGEDLINNSAIATITSDSIRWDIHFGNVHGNDYSQMNRIIINTEAQEGHA